MNKWQVCCPAVLAVIGHEPWAGFLESNTEERFVDSDNQLQRDEGVRNGR